jgi:hypothetical protein
MPPASRWCSRTGATFATESRTTRRVDRLILGEQGLETLPTEALHPGLRVLDVAHNRLTALPDDVATRQDLDVLYLCGNDFAELPPPVRLDLRWNPLAADPTPAAERLRARGCRVLT